jgi:plastocyanin
MPAGARSQSSVERGQVQRDRIRNGRIGTRLMIDVKAMMGRVRVAAVLACAAAACSGSVPQAAAVQSPTAPSASGYRWPLNATVTLTSEGPQPGSVIIDVGGRVTFVNSDTRPHEIVSDPYLRHEDCPPINRVGFLSPGQNRTSAVFEVVRDCGFHDHLYQAGVFGRIDVRIE